MASRIDEEGYARIMVVGASALGVLIAATLASRGYRTTLFGRDAVLLDCLVSRGARVVGDLPTSVPTLEATERLAAPATAFDLILVATGPSNAVAAARTSASWLADGGVLVAIGAGLHDAAIAQAVGRHRYLGAVATFCASTEDLGVVERCAEGSLIVGCPEPLHAPGWLVSEVETETDAAPTDDGNDAGAARAPGVEREAPPRDEERLPPDDPGADEREVPRGVGSGVPQAEASEEESDQGPSEATAGRQTEHEPLLARTSVAASDGEPPPSLQPTDGRVAWVLRALEALAPVRVTDNLLGARWAELTLQCAFEPLAAMAGLRAGELARHGFVRRLFLRIVDELEQLGAQLGVTPEPLLAIVGRGTDSEAPAAASEPAGRAHRSDRHELVHNVAGRYARAFGALAERMRAGREVTTESLREATLARTEGLAVELPVLAAVLDAVDRAAPSAHPGGLEAVRRLGE